MSGIEALLGLLGVDWPDADSGRARDAADHWRALRAALEAARADGDGAVRSLTCDNSGSEVSDFALYWEAYSGQDAHAAFPLLIECCTEMAEHCDGFADAVDHAWHRLVEEAAVLGVNAAFAVASGPLAELVEGPVINALRGTALETLTLFGDTVASIAARMVSGAALGALRSLLDQGVTDGVGLAFGERPRFSPAQVALSAASGGIAPAVTRVGTAAVASGSAAALERLPASFKEAHPHLGETLAAVPGAVQTPAGQLAMGVGGQEAAHELTGQGDLAPHDLAGSVLNSAAKAKLAKGPGGPPPPAPQ